MTSQTTNQFIKKAFTLAETLITLIIIGVIAATAIPTIMGAMPNSNKVKFKKAYSSTETVISNMINNDIIYPASLTFLGGDGVNYAQGFNNTSAIPNGNGAVTPNINKFCYYMADAMNIIGKTNCLTADAISTPFNFTTPPYTQPAFTTTDGVAWYIYIPVKDTDNASQTGASSMTTTSQFPLNSNYFTTKIIIDVNGFQSPNCTADSNFATYGLTQCTGKVTPDQYIIGVRYDGKLQVGCSTIVTGATCTTITDQGAIDILSRPTDNK